MTEETKKARAPRRSAAELAAEAQDRANSLRAKASKAKRVEETRQKVILGAGLMGLVDSGDAEAIKLLDRIKGKLTRPQDRGAFGLPPLAEPAADDPDALAAAIKAALVAHNEIPETDRAARRIAAMTWRNAVIAWEKVSGKFWLAEDKRAAQGFGALGMLKDG